MSLSIVATVRVKPGHETEFEVIAKKLAAAVNANQPGCLLYTLSRGEAPYAYVFMERYADDAAAAAHRASEHFGALGREMGAHMSGPPEVLRMTELA